MKHTRRQWFDLLSGSCENVTSSPKPEVHKVLNCRQRRTKSRPRVTRTENLLKMWMDVVNEIQRHVDHCAYYLAYLPCEKLINLYSEPCSMDGHKCSAIFQFYEGTGSILSHRTTERYRTSSEVGVKSCASFAIVVCTECGMKFCFE